MTSQLFLLKTLIDNSMQLKRVFRDRLNLPDARVHCPLRITRPMFMELLDRLETFIIRPTGRPHAIPMTTQLAVTLQFLATGTFQIVVASSNGISQCSVSRSIATVTDFFCDCAKDFICFPNVDGQKRNQLLFLKKYGFPKVLGCVDGSHISIVAPSTNEPFYVNRKG